MIQLNSRHCEEAFRPTRQSSSSLRLWIASLTLAMTALTLCACGYKTPGVSGNPGKMSADTLCYRAAYAKKDAGLKDEVKARGLDCAAILDSQQPVGESRY